MNQLDMMTTLVDAARQLPENAILAKAVKAADHRIEVLRQRYERRGYVAHRDEVKAEPAPPRCPHCNCRMQFQGGDFNAETCERETVDHWHCENCSHNEE